MALFRCFFRGENFATATDSGWQLMGFYTTRWVEAVDPAAAEMQAIEILRAEPAFQKPEGYEGQGVARVFLDEIEEVDALPQQPGSGATWFEMPG